MEIIKYKEINKTEDKYNLYMEGYHAAINKVLRILRDRNYTFGSSAKGPEEWALELEHFFKNEVPLQNL